MLTREECVTMSAEQMLTALGGFYKCPRETTERGAIIWLGPLAGYTSKDKKGRNRVGPEYVNFQVIGGNENALRVVAERMQGLAMSFFWGDSDKFTFCGIPTGGKTITDTIGEFSDYRCISAEKRKVGKTTGTTRAEEELYFTAGSEPKEGERIVIVEDVGNAFSTTAKFVRMIEDYGAEVILIALFLNRSMKIDEEFPFDNRLIPVRAQWREPMPIYEQDNAEVRGAEFILETKVRWGELMEAMEAHA